MYDPVSTILNVYHYCNAPFSGSYCLNLVRPSVLLWVYRLDKNEIAVLNVTYFASDGPSVMLGAKNGVVAHLKRDNPTVLNMHCMNHRLQLAVSKSFISILWLWWDYLDIITTVLAIMDLPNWFSSKFSIFVIFIFSIRTESLNAMQTLLRDMCELDTKNNLTIQKSCEYQMAKSWTVFVSHCRWPG